MRRLFVFAPALAVMAVGITLFLYNMNNAAIRLLGMALLLVSVALIRLNQMNSARRDGYEPATRHRKRNVVVLIIASLVIASLAIGAGLSLTSNDPRLQTWGSKVMLVTIGAMAALIGGVVNYFSTRKKDARHQL